MGVARKISVVISVYNGFSYLHESIDSILNQTFVNTNLFLMDILERD